MTEPGSYGSNSGQKVAPGALATVQSFINTVDFETNVDKFSTPAALAQWVHENHLLDERMALSDSDLRHAIDVREALRELVSANDGQAASKSALETLGRAARSAHLHLEFQSNSTASLAPASSGLDAALGKLLTIVFKSMSDGTWQRLKTCEAETCRWAFYDASKNRSGHWCIMSVCGNRTKARKYRSRKTKQASNTAA